MPNLLKFNKEAQDSLLRGVNTMADAIGSTLGPLGRNVAIEQALRPLVIHDGVGVAKSIELKDPFEKLGADLIKDAAIKTNSDVGDGTTTVSVLTQSLVNEAFKQIQAGANPQQVRERIEASLKVVLGKLKGLAKDISTDEEIQQVATISSGSEELGKLIAEVFKQVGVDGSIVIEEGMKAETTVDYMTGYEVSAGYFSKEFQTSKEDNKAVVEDPYILFTDLKLSHEYDVLPFVERFIKISKKLVIFCSSLEGEAFNFFILNKLKGSLEVIVSQAPSFGSRRIDELEDLAVLTGAKVIRADSGTTLDKIEITDLGRATKVIADWDKTIIVGAKGKTPEIEARTKEIKAQIANATTPYDKDMKENRLAKFTGKQAVINVGGQTDVEMRNKRESVIDAKNATKCAIEEGVVAGGEVTLYYLAEEGSTEVLDKALRAPIKKLLENAGREYADVTRWLTGYPNGLDIKKGIFDDMIKLGVIDPVKVTRSALENAVSIACQIITTSVLVVEERVEK